MIEKDKNISKKITFFLFFIFFLVGAFTFKDYGISVDELAHRKAGFYWLDYILKFTPFQGLSDAVTLKLSQIKGLNIASHESAKYYGIAFDLPAAFLEVIFKIDDPKNYFHLKHFLNFTLFFVGSIFFYKLLLNRFSSFNIALIGTLFFVLSPRIYGHSFFNNKDIVFLSLLSISLYYCFKCLEKIDYKNLLIFSIIVAFCTSSRILGIYLPIFFLIFYALGLLSKKKNLNNILQIIFFCFSYSLFLIVFWPVLWSGPIEQFFQAFEHFSEFGGFTFKFLFNGQYIDPQIVPYGYMFTWFFITTPILYIILFVFGYIKIFKRFFLRFINIKEKAPYYDLWRSVNEKKDLFIFLSLTALVLYIITFRVVLYTGWRHVYFLNIFIIYIATYAFYELSIVLRNKNKKKLLYGVVSVFLIFTTYKMIIYHPFQNIYFNSFFNKEPHKKFEIDYWGLSGKKFLEDILILENNKVPIKIAVASFLQLERSLKLMEKNKRSKIQIIGQNYKDADYIYTNFISDVDIRGDDKYNIPANFLKIDEFIIDGNIRVYEVYKKE